MGREKFEHATTKTRRQTQVRAPFGPALVGRCWRTGGGLRDGGVQRVAGRVRWLHLLRSMGRVDAALARGAARVARSVGALDPHPVLRGVLDRVDAPVAAP
eukprot:5717366-Prymnesium_polylepis.1